MIRRDSGGVLPMAKKTSGKKFYIPMRVMRWSSMIIDWPIGCVCTTHDTKVAGSVGFLPAYESRRELTKRWGGDAPYITVEVTDPEE